MENIPQAAAKWIVRLVHEHWRPTIPAFPAVDQIEWEGKALEGTVSSASIKNDRLTVEIETPLGSPSVIRNLGPAGELRLRFADGSLVRSAESFLSHRGSSYRAQGGGSHRFAVTAFDWNWRPSDQPGTAVVWYASVRGSLRNSHNVIVRGREEETGRGLWLEGAERSYFLIDETDFQADSSESTIDLLAFGGDDVSRKHLWHDFRALEFLLGRRLCVETIAGIDATGAVVRVYGGVIGSLHPRNCSVAPAVPLLGIKTWLAPFFSKLSRAQAERRELALHVPLSYYVESLGGFVDVEFLALQVALEAFAKVVLNARTTEKKLAVKDRKAWNKWIEEHADELRSHSVPGKEESLVNRVRELSRNPTGRHVEDAFGSFGQMLLPEQVAVIEDRNTVAHTALMIKDGVYDFQRDLSKIALVRSMLVALLGLAIGYKGQIRGWQHPDIGNGTAPVDWWPVDRDDEAAASNWYRAAYPSETTATE